MAKVLLLLLSLPALVLAANIKDCGSEATVNTQEIEVTGCSGSTACIFRKGHLAKISLPFTPNFESQGLKAVVQGIIGGLPVDFPLPHPNACTESGLQCPLQAGKKYTYTASLPVRKIYPSISLVVKWQLMDSNKPIVCIEIPVRLQ